MHLRYFSIVIDYKILRQARKNYSRIYADCFLFNGKTLPKAQRTRGLSSAYQSNFFRSYHKFLHKSWSNIFRISTKHQLQNLNQASAFWRNLNLKLLTKPIFRILTKIELHNHMKHQQQNNDQTSASKSCLNINFKILTKPWKLVFKVWTKN